MEKLVCVVVLYNPDECIVEKVKTYHRLFNDVILVDNSTTPLEGSSFNSRNTQYVSMEGNMGICCAFNVGMHKAIELGYNWVMLLDQDSILDTTCVRKLKKLINTVDKEEVAIVSANYEPEKHNPESGIEEVNFVISSGSVLNTSIFSRVGEFIEDMFIDAVDYEYCYRVVSKGYKVIRDNSAVFKHFMGNKTYVNDIECRNYPAFRYYFITRNNLIVSKMYESLVPESKKLRVHIEKYRKSARHESDSIRKYFYIIIAKLDYLLWLRTGKYYCHIKIK